MRSKLRYAIVIEKAGANYSAYVPDLPGCIATGNTVAKTEQSIREAIELHLSGMREDGQVPGIRRGDLDSIAGDEALVRVRTRFK